MTTSTRLARSLLLAAFLMLALVIPAAPVQAAPPSASAAETASLLTIYNNLDGINWADNTNWNNGGDPCAAGAVWYGVDCDGAGNVVTIDLNNNDLDGDIGDIDLSGLPNLQELTLYSNSIYGSIGDLTLDGVPNLEILDLYDNLIGGNIGGLDLGGVPNLEVLDLYDNQIGGNTDDLDFSGLPNLWYLDLGDNLIGGEIDHLNIIGLTNLEEFYLDDNLVSGDIDHLDIIGLPNLRLLYLDNNQIGGSVGRLDLSGAPNLEELSLWNNRIGGKIEKLDLSSVPGLYYLYLDGNRIEGDIGGFNVTGLIDLEELYLYDNFIAGDPSELDLSNNVWLYDFPIFGNYLDGTVPDMTNTGMVWGASGLCGGDNIVRPSGDAGIDGYAEASDATNWSATYGCPNLAASVRCNNDDLKVFIQQGEGPFDIDGTGTGLPILGSGLRIDGTPALGGPGEWTGISISETAGDTQVMDFDDFHCDHKSGGMNKGGEEEATVIVEPGVSSPGWESSRPAHDLWIVLSGSPSQAAVAPGDILTWTFVVENQGSSPSEPLSFSAMLPDGLTGVTVETTQGTVISVGPPTATVDLGSIPAGGSVTITISGTWAGGLPRQGGEARQGVRARVVPGHANQEAGDEVCMLAMVADQSLNSCVTVFPSSLPETGGQPVEPVQWGWIAAAAAVLIGAGAWIGVRRKAAA